MKISHPITSALFNCIFCHVRLPLTEMALIEEHLASHSRLGKFNLRFGFGWPKIRFGAIFYSWLGMGSIQHEIFIESIYNNQKLSILREYSITSCDHQTIFSCFYSPFYRSVWRFLFDRLSFKIVFNLFALIGWERQPINIQNSGHPFSVGRFCICTLEFWKPKIIFDLGTRQNFDFHIRFSRQWHQIFGSSKIKSF